MADVYDTNVIFIIHDLWIDIVKCHNLNYSFLFIKYYYNNN